MGAVLVPARPRQERPQIYPDIGMPDKFFADEDPQVYGMPGSRDRNLHFNNLTARNITRDLVVGLSMGQ